MRLLDRLLGGDSARFNPNNVSGAATLMTTFGSPNDEKILPTFFNAAAANANSGVVFGVILARIMLFSEVEFKFQRLVDKKLWGDPRLAKLEEPWPGATTGDLLARMEQDASLAGNAFIRDASEHLERLRPDWVTIVSEIVRENVRDTQVRRVLGYFYDPPVSEGREPAFYPVDEVAHWSPIPDPLANYRGMSWLTPVLREVDADQSMTDYKRAYLENAATPNLLIKYKQKVGQTKIDTIAEQVTARHGGVGNAFKTLVLDEGADHAVLGNNFEQMTFAAVQAAGENRIAVAGNTPAIVAGLKEGLDAATYSNYGLAMRRFGDMYGRPAWRSASGALAKLVDVPADSRLWYDASGVTALREGDKDRADTMNVLAQAAQALVIAGYEPDSVNLALSAGDITLLKHTGLVSVQMQKPGTATTPQGGAQ